jgi:DNA-binding NarL/FixJ family response regulator
MHNKQILIVDDAPLIRTRLRSMLEGLPGMAPILLAGTYAGAIELLGRDHPDIVLLDINLPDRNGLDLLRYISQHHPGATVIMCSNQSSPFYRNLCRRLGAAWFIDKSTEFENIPAIIAQFL